MHALQGTISRFKEGNEQYFCAAKVLNRPVSFGSHSRRGRLLPVVGRLPQCPESGRKVRASASVAMGQQRSSTLAHSITSSVLGVVLHRGGIPSALELGLPSGRLGARLDQRKQLVGNFEAERFGDFEVDDQFNPGRLHRGQVGRFLAFGNPTACGFVRDDGFRYAQALAELPANSGDGRITKWR